MRVLRNLLIPLVALGAAASAAQAATIPVTTTSDVIANDGLCSLREAVFAARADLAIQGCPAGSGTTRSRSVREPSSSRPSAAGRRTGTIRATSTPAL